MKVARLLLCRNGAVTVLAGAGWLPVRNGPPEGSRQEGKKWTHRIAPSHQYQLTDRPVTVFTSTFNPRTFLPDIYIHVSIQYPRFSVYVWTLQCCYCWNITVCNRYAPPSKACTLLYMHDYRLIIWITLPTDRRRSVNRYMIYDEEFVSESGTARPPTCVRTFIWVSGSRREPRRIENHYRWWKKSSLASSESFCVPPATVG